MLREQLKKQRHPIKNSFKIPDDMQKHHQKVKEEGSQKQANNRANKEEEES